MEKKINSMTFEEVLEKLRAPLEEAAFESGSWFPALSYRFVQKRLGEVLGYRGYRFIVTNYEIVTINHQPNVLVSGSLSILDDNDEVVIELKGIGGSRVILLEKENPEAEREPLNVANDIECACHDCFKRCAKQLGIGVAQLEARRKKEGRKGHGTATGEAVTVKLMTNFTSRGKGLVARCVLDNAECDIVIWPNKFNQIATLGMSVEEFVKICGEGKQLRCQCSIGSYKGAKQLTFLGFSKGEK